MIRFLTILCIVATLCPVSFGAMRKTSRKSVNVAELLEKGNNAYLTYDLETLREILESLDEAKPTADQEREIETLRNHSIAMTNMLARVQDLVILDSLDVPLDSVGSAYVLTRGMGMLTATSHTPADKRERFQTVADSTGKLSVAIVPLLDDGTELEPVPVNLFPDDEMAETAYPFLASDGSTLYFSALNVGGDNNLGGWDTYMTRRDDSGQFMQPVNMGMPYNTPDNDFMLALDGESGLGWFATDRNALGGDTVTVYIFKIADTRVNLPQEDPDYIAGRAFIISLAQSWPEGVDGAEQAASALDKIRQDNRQTATGGNFALSLGNGKIITDPAQLSDNQARNLARKYLDRQNELASTRKSLASLRSRYGKGEKNLKKQILDLERKEETLQKQVKSAANAVVRACR